MLFGACQFYMHPSSHLLQSPPSVILNFQTISRLLLLSALFFSVQLYCTCALDRVKSTLLPRRAVGLGAPRTIIRCMCVCHRGHYKALSRCQRVGSCVLPGENFFDTVAGNLAVNSVFITFRSMRDTNTFHFFHIPKLFFCTKLPFPLPWWSKDLLVENLLASNLGPHHFDLLNLREEGLGKLPAILEIVRSMDRFDHSFHRFSLWPSLACPATRWVVLTSLVYNLQVFVSINKAIFKSWRMSAIDKQSDSICNQTVDILRVRVSKSRFWCRFWSRSCVISVSTNSQKKSWKRKVDRRRPRRLYRLDGKTLKA